MIFFDDGKVRLTRDKLSLLRREAARKGDVVGDATTSRELADAVAAALPDEALAAFETFAMNQAGVPSRRNC